MGSGGGAGRAPVPAREADGDAREAPGEPALVGDANDPTRADGAPGERP
jgi:hypothetical protein